MRLLNLVDEIVRNMGSNYLGNATNVIFHLEDSQSFEEPYKFKLEFEDADGYPLGHAVGIIPRNEVTDARTYLRALKWQLSERLGCHAVVKYNTIDVD